MTESARRCGVEVSVEGSWSEEGVFPHWLLKGRIKVVPQTVTSKRREEDLPNIFLRSNRTTSRRHRKLCSSRSKIRGNSVNYLNGSEPLQCRSEFFEMQSIWRGGCSKQEIYCLRKKGDSESAGT